MKKCSTWNILYWLICMYTARIFMKGKEKRQNRETPALKCDCVFQPLLLAFFTKLAAASSRLLPC
jgi:uncharacterized membrane protein